MAASVWKSSACPMSPSIPLGDRRALLSKLDRVRFATDAAGSLDGMDRMRQQAFETILGGVADGAGSTTLEEWGSLFLKGAPTFFVVIAVEAAADEISQVAASTGLELRPLHGRHDQAVIATLPVARGLAPKGQR